MLPKLFHSYIRKFKVYKKEYENEKKLKDYINNFGQEWNGFIYFWLKIVHSVKRNLDFRAKRIQPCGFS